MFFIILIRDCRENSPMMWKRQLIQFIEYIVAGIRDANLNLTCLTLTGFPLISLSRCSSGVERFLGKEEVMGSIPIIGSKQNKFETIDIYKF
jgi:hypothetical protein